MPAKIECGIGRKVTTISDMRSDSRLPVLR